MIGTKIGLIFRDEPLGRLCLARVLTAIGTKVCLNFDGWRNFQLSLLRLSNSALGLRKNFEVPHMDQFWPPSPIAPVSQHLFSLLPQEIELVPIQTPSFARNFLLWHI